MPPAARRVVRRRKVRFEIEVARARDVPRPVRGTCTGGRACVQHDDVGQVLMKPRGGHEGSRQGAHGASMPRSGAWRARRRASCRVSPRALERPRPRGGGGVWAERREVQQNPAASGVAERSEVRRRSPCSTGQSGARAPHTPPPRPRFSSRRRRFELARRHGISQPRTRGRTVCTKCSRSGVRKKRSPLA